MNLANTISAKKQNMHFVSKTSKNLTIKFDADTTNRYGVTFLQRIKTPLGLGSVIGEAEGQLWFWLDKDDGVSYWDTIMGNVFSVEGFTKSSEKIDEYPSRVSDFIYDIFAVDVWLLTKLDGFDDSAEPFTYEKTVLQIALEKLLIFNPENLNLACAYPDKGLLLDFLPMINAKNKIQLSAEIFAQLMHHTNAQEIMTSIILFARADILNQDILIALIQQRTISETRQKKIEKYFLTTIAHLNISINNDIIIKECAKFSYLPLYQIAKDYHFISNNFINFVEECTNSKDKDNNELWLHYVDYFLEIFDRPQDYLKKLSQGQLAKLVNTALKQPALGQKLADHLAQLKRLDIFDGAFSINTWTAITMAFAKRMPPPTKQGLSALAIALQQPVTEQDFVPLSLDEKTQSAWTFLRCQGRTILLQNKAEDILAIKIQKDKEGLNELGKEFYTTTCLKKLAKEIRLQGELPQPVSLNKITDVLAWLKPKVSQEEFAQFSLMVGTKESYGAYLYQVDKNHHDYFTYLHDSTLTDKEFSEANRISIYNLCILLSLGIVYPQLADLFHNKEPSHHKRQDKGRYIVLTDLINDVCTGTGRLTGWKEAINFPNIRGPHSGLADWGDWAPLSAFFADGAYTQTFFQRNEWAYSQKVSNYLIANILAEYQYVLFLIAGRRGCDLTNQAKLANQSSKAITDIWLTLAQQIFANCVLAITTLTNRQEGEVKAFLSKMVDVERLARQMQFWLTDEYIPYLKRDEIPAGIYENSTYIRVEFANIRHGTFNDKIGCSIDGDHPDLGTTNGQEPIKEANKLFYWMNTIIYSAYAEYSLLYEDIANLKKADQPEKVAKVKSEAFTYLPAQKFHAAHLAWSLHELKQTKLANLDPKQLTELVEHKRQYAAATIQSFWRQHQVGHNQPLREEVIAKPRPK